MTGIGWLDTLLLSLVVATSILTPLTLVVRKVRPIVKQLTNFLEDWFGEPERPGVAARPGILLRLVKIERELKPNGGSSMRDAVDRVETAGKATSQRLDDHITASEEDRSHLRLDLGGLTREMARLVDGQGQQDDVIANLSKALPIVARSTPPHEHEEG